MSNNNIYYFFKNNFSNDFVAEEIFNFFSTDQLEEFGRHLASEADIPFLDEENEEDDYEDDDFNTLDL